ncbi:rve domain-containing protein [Gossypium australe]|uniref:Rve domain-containing protein n=1 Tax=Gossypium australe TaxID=47621 RepID=A0A5B6V9Q3_9ROSI|nr:rve domain-containing protein [Gossypium australe]
MESFLLKSIVCKLSIPRLVITDNISAKTPQMNGQVEAMKKKILTALKRKVDEAKGSWLKELPGIMWALRTSPHTTTREIGM